MPVRFLFVISFLIPVVLAGQIQFRLSGSGMAKAEDHGLGLVEIDHRVAVIMQTRERDNRYHLWLQYWDPAVGAPQDSIHLTVTPGIYYLRLATPLAGGGLALLGHHGEGAFELITFGADGMQTGRFLPPPETNGQLQDVWQLPDGQLLLQSRSSIGTNISVYAYEQQLYKIGEGITWRGNLAGTAQAEIRDLRTHADGTYTVCGSLSDSAWLATYRGTKPLRQRTLGAAARSYDMEVRYGVIKNLLPVRQDTLYTIAAYAGLAPDVRLALDADWSPISDTLLPLVFGAERSERVANGSVYTIETGWLEPHGLKRTELFSAGDTFVRSYWQGAEGELRDLLVLNDTILVLQEHTTKTSQRTNLTALSADLRTEYWQETVGRPLRKSYSRFSSVAGQAIAFYRPATAASGESDLHVLRQPEGVPEKVELPDWAQAAHLLATEGDTLTLLLTDLRGQAEVWWTLAGRPVQRIRIDGLGDHRRREELYSYQDGQLYLLTTMDRRGDSLDLTAMVEQGLTFGDLLKPIPVLTQIDLRTGQQMRTVLQDLLDVRVRSLDLSGPLALISGRLLSKHETICAVYNLREKRIATYTIPTPQGELAYALSADATEDGQYLTFLTKTIDAEQKGQLSVHLINRQLGDHRSVGIGKTAGDYGVARLMMVDERIMVVSSEVPSPELAGLDHAYEFRFWSLDQLSLEVLRSAAAGAPGGILSQEMVVSPLGDLLIYGRHVPGGPDTEGYFMARIPPSFWNR